MVSDTPLKRRIMNKTVSSSNLSPNLKRPAIEQNYSITQKLRKIYSSNLSENRSQSGNNSRNHNFNTEAYIYTYDASYLDFYSKSQVESKDLREKNHSIRIEKGGIVKNDTFGGVTKNNDGVKISIGQVAKFKKQFGTVKQKQKKVLIPVLKN